MDNAAKNMNSFYASSHSARNPVGSFILRPSVMNPQSNVYDIVHGDQGSIERSPFDPPSISHNNSEMNQQNSRGGRPPLVPNRNNASSNVADRY